MQEWPSGRSLVVYLTQGNNGRMHAHTHTHMQADYYFQAPPKKKC